MSGSRYLIDTNAIVVLLQGNNQLAQLLKQASWLGISVISQIEFLAFPKLSQADQQLFEAFLQRVEVIDLKSNDNVLISQIIEVRQRFRLKLPDAIIAAMAIQNSANIVTADKAFSRVDTLSVIGWE
ncbi:MAG: type II toxin-antitoxin system VapC family toxin [Cyanobacteria bacterium J06573_11]